MLFTRLGVALLPLIQLRVGPQLTASDSLLAIALVCWAAVVIRRPTARRAAIPFALVAGLVSAGLCVTSLYHPDNPPESFANALKVCFSLFVVGGVITCAVAIGRDLAGLAWAYCLGSALATLSALLRIGGAEAVYQAGDNTRLAGLAGNPVGLAISAGVALAILFHLRPSGRLGPAVQIILIVLNVTGIIVAIGLTGAVIAVFGTLVGQFYIPNVARAFRRASALFVLAIAFLVANSRWDLFTTISERFTGALNPSQGISTAGGSNGSTLSLRLYTWQISLDRIGQHPFVGNGFDDSGQLSYGTVDTHNYFLLSWQTGGLLMLTIALILFVLSILAAVRLWKMRKVFSVPYIVAALAATWPGAMSSPALYGRSLYFVIALAVSAAFVGRQLLAQSSPEVSASPL